MNDLFLKLWDKVNAEERDRSIIDFGNSLSELNNMLKVLPPYERIESDLKTSKQSISIIFSLKNEASKERHWKIIIDKIVTGMDFNLNAVTFVNIIP